MDEQSVARTPRPVSPPDPEDHARLLEAARAALRWFEEFDRHAPSDFVFGGEAQVRRRLRRAIRRAS